MKQNNSLDALIQTLASTPPVLSSETAFRENVWREIRHRKAVCSPGNSWREYFSLFLQPRLGFATVTLAVAISFTCAFLLGFSDSSRNSREQLNLQVFSPTASGLPSTSLVSPR